MAGRPARLKFANAPSVTLTNEYIITKTARFNDDLLLTWSKLTVGVASPAYLNYDWVLEAGASTVLGSTMTVAGDINFTGSQTFEKLCTFLEGLAVSTGDLVVSAGGINAAAANIVAGAAVQAGTTMTAGTGITATTGNIVAAAGNITASAEVNGNSIAAGTDLNITAGGILVSTDDANIHDTVEVVAGNITATLGAVEATAGTVTAGTGLTATTGGLTLDDGDLDVTLGNIVVAAGDITATLGSIAVGTTVTAGTALVVEDSLAVAHSITGSAAGQMEWDATPITAVGVFERSLYSMSINEAAGASPADIATAVLANNTYVTVDAIVNGIVIGEAANANIGDYYSVRVFASFTNKGGVLAAEAMTTRDEVLHDGIGAGTKPVFISDINAANWRIQCTQGDDGAGKNNEILWRGEAKVTVTAI